ncbi:uncharacterized protein SAPINGB_P004524 [Magnusiomyces paraingens]|uniref:RRM domain-containing protein n=1 Tax=Magnusiomyces paraingens TaxID=2606893 RepID=A0A5E8BV53_9ASCO|nr:uncharacterized protein SAPINGB_P004524 [Saprochaete ingens]VVT55293.1 unnamed protein product [Saprochaete ingens]
MTSKPVANDTTQRSSVPRSLLPPKAPSGAPEAFKALIQALDDARVTQVQILPADPGPEYPPGALVVPIEGGHGNLIAVEGVLAVPKRLLKGAFLHANRVFHELLYGYIENDENVVLATTKVILLTVTEHLPAINARKRVIMGNIDLLKAELIWQAQLFCSALPKQTKSPMLWRHRQWVVAQLDRNVIEYEAEIEIILAAAHMHRCNYYAWAYARWLLRGWKPSAKGTDSDAIYVRVLNFCRAHVSDISSWTFLLDYLAGLPEIKSNVDLTEKQKNCLADNVEAIEAFKQVAPGHESIEYFLICADAPMEDLTSVDNTVEDVSKAAEAMRSIEGWILIATNLHEEATEEDVLDFFSDFGTVQNLHLNLDRRTGYVKGYALIEFATPEEARAAVLDGDGAELLGRRINVDFAIVQPTGKEENETQSSRDRDVSITVYLKPGKPYRIGRKNLELTLNSKAVSRHHATITAEKADGSGAYNLTVYDESSKGGTFINANTEPIPSKEPTLITKLPKRLSNSCEYAFLWLGKNRSSSVPREYEIQLTWVPLDCAYRVDGKYARSVEDVRKKMAALGIHMSANMTVFTCMLVQPATKDLQERISNKLVYALTQGFPIVTPDYCTEVQKVLNQNQVSFEAPGMAFVDTGSKDFFQVWSLTTDLVIKSILPDPSKFVPENDIQLLPDPRRKKIFSTFIFGLWGRPEFVQGLKPIFEGAGGRCAVHSTQLPVSKEPSDDLIKDITTFLDLLANSPENRNIYRVVPVISEDPQDTVNSVIIRAAQNQAKAIRSGPAYSGRVEVLQPVTTSEIAEAIRTISTTVIEGSVEIPEEDVPIEVDEEKEEGEISADSVKPEPLESPLKKVKVEELSLTQAFSTTVTKFKPRSRNPYLSGLTKTTALDDYVGSAGLAKPTKSVPAKAARTRSKKAIGGSGKEKNLLDLWASMPVVEHKQDLNLDPDPILQPEAEPELVPEEEKEPEADELSESPSAKRRRISRLEILDDEAEDADEVTKLARQPHKPEPQQEFLSKAANNLAQTSADTAFVFAKKRKTKVHFAQAVLATKDTLEEGIAGDANIEYTPEEVAAMRNLAIVDEMEMVEPGVEGPTRASTRDTVVSPCDMRPTSGSMSESKWGLRPNFKSFRKSSVYGSGSVWDPNISKTNGTDQPSVFVTAVIELVQANPNENRLRNNKEFLELDVRKKSRERMAEKDKENDNSTDANANANAMALVRRKDSQDSLFVGGIREDEEEEEEEEQLNRVFEDKRPAAKVSADEFSLVVAGSRNEPHNESVESDSESESESESDSDEEERNQLVVAKRRRMDIVPQLRRDVIVRNGIVPRRPQSLLLGGPIESNQWNGGYNQRQLMPPPNGDDEEEEEEEEEINRMIGNGEERVPSQDENEDEDDDEEQELRLDRPRIVIERRTPQAGPRRGGLLLSAGSGGSRNNTRTPTTHGFLIEDEDEEEEEE